MIKYKLWFFDVFHLGNNIVIQRLDFDRFKPIIIDFKRSGWASYPLQLNLILDSQKEKKLLRRYERFREMFQS